MSVERSALGVERSGEAGRAVFLSYASQDAVAAKRICEALRAAGVEVWFDQSELRGGDAWDAKIRKQIKECALFVPVISANTQARAEGYFRREWKLAVDRTHDMADHVAFLVPVVIDRTKDAEAFVPEKFREVQWTRFAGGAPNDEFPQRIAALLQGREANAGGTAAVVATPERRPEVVPLPSRVPHSSRSVTTRLVVAVLAAGLVVAGGVVFFKQWERASVLRRLHEELIPELDRRLAAGDMDGAFKFAIAAERLHAADSELRKRWSKAVREVTVESDPPGADVYVKPFHQPKTEWRHLGQTPLTGVRLPQAYVRWRLEKPGFAPLDVQRPTSTRKVTMTLHPVSSVPAEMVWVSGGSVPPNSTGLRVALRLPDYLIDRFEVTNRQFKQFVDAGGYAKPEWWRQPFVRGDATLSHAAAMAEFRDGTGQPGPASWQGGTFPDGDAELPVTGVSWFEAAAYAEWTGKRLPSVYHWRYAARPAVDDESLVPLSNFSGRGAAPVGTYQGVSACGAFDLAGNVKEWCWNAAAPDVRYLLGGAWREPEYMFVGSDALSPFDRSETNGFRCIKLVGPEPVAAEMDAAVEPQVRDFASEKPVSDEVFAAIRSMYAYDKRPLEARLDGSDDADPRWRKEKVSYLAAYGDERISALLFLPRNAAPPYQTIVYFPGSGAVQSTSSETNLRDADRISVLVASGRALLYPIYKGTYERRSAELSSRVMGAATYRDWLIMMSKDLGRSIDYLETRPDIQATKLAYVGSSWGGALGAIFPALEPRIKVNVLIIAGLYRFKPLPEVDQLNFVSRNTAPTLMLSGRYDFVFPLETSQRPMFRLLGAPPEHKRHVLFDTGHALKSEQVASAAYAWLDQYLGLVK